jgi:hypothetical protein
MVQVCFKLCFTSQTVSYTVPGDQKMSEFYVQMKGEVRRDLGIDEDNDFYILPGLGLQYKGYEACPEDHPPVLTDYVETVEEYCNRDEICNRNEIKMFYVRLWD